MQPHREPTEQERADLEKRRQSCNEELVKIFEKYELGLSAQPAFTPDGRIGAIPTFTDEKFRKAVAAEQQKSSESGLQGSEN